MIDNPSITILIGKYAQNPIIIVKWRIVIQSYNQNVIQ